MFFGLQLVSASGVSFTVTPFVNFDSNVTVLKVYSNRPMMRLYNITVINHIAVLAGVDVSLWICHCPPLPSFNVQIAGIILSITFF